MGHLTGLFIEVAFTLLVTWRVMLRVERYRQSLLPDPPEAIEHAEALRAAGAYAGPLSSDRIPTHRQWRASHRTTSGGTTVRSTPSQEALDVPDREPAAARIVWAGPKHRHVGGALRGGRDPGWSLEGSTPGRHRLVGSIR